MSLTRGRRYRLSCLNDIVDSRYLLYFGRIPSHHPTTTLPPATLATILSFLFQLKNTPFWNLPSNDTLPPNLRLDSGITRDKHDDILRNPHVIELLGTKLRNTEASFWGLRVRERGRHNDVVQPVCSLTMGTEREGSRRMDRVTRSSDPHILLYFCRPT